MLASLKRALAHPLTKGLALDDPETTSRRRTIIRNKAFLNRLYIQWYERIIEALPAINGAVVEVGSGGGFMKELMPAIVSTEVFRTEGIDLVMDAQSMPFRAESVRAFALIDVMHHVPKPERFLREAVRVLKPGGRILMIEPWVNGWASMVYKNFHHEPFDPSGSWTIPPSGPLSGANGALPWILFERDRTKFEESVPSLAIETIEPFMPVAYLLSGGVSMRSLLPGWFYRVVRSMEQSIPALERRTGMFAFIQLNRIA